MSSAPVAKMLRFKRAGCRCVRPVGRADIYVRPIGERLQMRRYRTTCFRKREGRQTLRVEMEADGCNAGTSSPEAGFSDEEEANE